jgi:hypothetical protein
MGSCQSTEAVSAGNVGAEGRPHGGTKKPLPNGKIILFVSEENLCSMGTVFSSWTSHPRLLSL